MVANPIATVDNLIATVANEITTVGFSPAWLVKGKACYLFRGQLSGFIWHGARLFLAWVPNRSRSKYLILNSMSTSKPSIPF